MGKPYKSEIQQLPHTYRWALSLDCVALRNRIDALASYPLITIGSGGSQSTATLVADLHQTEFGQVAKADTPLSAWSYIKDLKRSAILMVSAGGKNPDILGIAKAVVESEPASLIAMCATRNSPLARVVKGFSRGFCFDFVMPAGKDGFLATNSLLALSVTALRAYGYDAEDLPRSFEAGSQISGGAGPAKRWSDPSRLLSARHLIALHGAQSRSAAFDLESKLVEAGLISVQLADYRNFAHGRHHWLAKNPDSAVVAFASREETLLAERTLELIPREIPSLLIASPASGFASWVGLQAAVFDLVAKFGVARKIDPGRPGVPEFGRRIYHLNAFRRSKGDMKSTAIARKKKSWGQTDAEYLQQLDTAFSETCERFRKAKFHGLILDYDGTVCDHVDRFGAIPKTMAEALNHIVEAGFLLGIATGRGKSVRQALQAAISKSAWQRVRIGYYNGGVVADLRDDTQPTTNCSIAPQLQNASNALHKFIQSQFVLSIRPQQITVEARGTVDVRELWSHVAQRLEEAGVNGVKVVASTRSVDVVPEGTSKVALVRLLKETRPNSTFLCIGDRPCWPGNDAQLLSEDFSLSVDEVDGSPSGAWNLAPAGILGAAALRFYLSKITTSADYFSIKLGCN
jgi:hydroxymethylpyrimidine pyrophosphatase-like HAD family hydrolase/fructoselysine-6-P-deglycase FrlB-like protein